MMSKLRIAVQKSGRLHEQSIQLLKDCGLSISNGKDQLKADVSNYPIEILYLRNSDIPQYIDDGTVDLAIVGENLLIEKNKEYVLLEKLGFSKCRVSIAIPKNQTYSSVNFLQGKKIATSYPETLKAFLYQNNIHAEIHVISGSVEIAPNIGLADAICDIVSSGSTLFKNGLKETQTILESQAVLVSSAVIDKSKSNDLDQLLFRIRAVLKAKQYKYILLNVKNENIKSVSNILPVLNSPTVLPLAKPGWSSLHSVIEENEFWEVIDSLRNAGAKDILIVPIDKMVK